MGCTTQMAEDYVWHMAMTFADRFTAGVAHKEETYLKAKEDNSATERSFSVQELLHRCPLQRSIPLQAILKRFDCIDSQY